MCQARLLLQYWKRCVELDDLRAERPDLLKAPALRHHIWEKLLQELVGELLRAGDRVVGFNLELPVMCRDATERHASSSSRGMLTQSIRRQPAPPQVLAGEQPHLFACLFPDAMEGAQDQGPCPKLRDGPSNPSCCPQQRGWG